MSRKERTFTSMRDKFHQSLQQILTSVLDLIVQTIVERAVSSPKSRMKYRTPSRKKVELETSYYFD